MADYPHESFRLDGEPGSIRSSARQWATFGGAASGAAGHIRSLDTSLFIGPEGDQYREGLSDSLPPHLDTTGEAYNKVAKALTTFADDLSHLQDRMRPLANKAPSLWESLHAAQGRASAAQAADKQHTQQLTAAAATRPADQPAPPDNYHSDSSAASASLSHAQQQWNDCLNAANQVKVDHKKAVDACERAVRDAAAMRFAHNPHGFGKLLQGAKDFVKDHAAGLAKLSGVLKVVSGIAGVLSFIPVLNFVMAPLAIATGAAALAIDVAIYAATGKGSLTNIIIDGALLALPGVGKLAAPAIRNSRAAAQEARAISHASQRAKDLQASVPAASRGRITMAVGIGKDASGKVRTVVGTSEPRGYLRPGVKLEAGEELATGSGHAEVSVLTHMKDNNISPTTVGAGRSICDNCAISINDAGVIPATPLKNPDVLQFTQVTHSGG